MERGAPTRQHLLMLKGRHEVIKRGLDLLKSKREALMKEFFGIVEEAVRMREELAALLQKAQRGVETARALYGPAVESFALASKREVSLDITIRNVWGINVPEIREITFRRAIDARGVSVAGEKAAVMRAAEEFEGVADLIVRIASVETRLQRVGEMIKADTRKINAISEMILPSMRRRVKSIERTLEEREREEVFRLKRFKSMRSPRV